MACHEYRFKISDFRSPKPKSTICNLNSTAEISELIAKVYELLDDDDLDWEVFWKLGTSCHSENDECLNDLPPQTQIQDFVKDHFHHLTSPIDEFYLTVHKKTVSNSGSAYKEQTKDEFEASWSFIATKPSTSDTSTLEANAGTTDSLTTPSSNGFAFPDSKLPQRDDDDEKLMDDTDDQQHDIPDNSLMDQTNPPSPTRRGFGFASVKRETDDVYVGLVNQAMTCYLNSLLQTLFMTPEFRNALYNWEYTGTKEEQSKSIPYQLQKLFVLLQTSVGMKTSLETKDLTKSFGWDSSHAWDQHDVQELCRVMFDALEMKWRRTNQATVITALYQGTMKDYVKCLECSTENARSDVFLDLPLAIKPFGATQAYRSVEEALQGFVQPEVLDGSNKYHCDKCQKKVNAHKGLKITKFPYLLTIQLKRFDFDYTTMHRIKLNDRMTFPDFLNLNPFVEVQEPNVAAAENGPVVEENISDQATVMESIMDTQLEDGDKLPSNVVEKEAVVVVNGGSESDDEGICVDGTTGGGNSSAGSPIDADEEAESGCPSEEHSNSTNRSYLQEVLKDGPYVYELFSIMVHSGSANGGHYYAYIRNLDTKVWYCFNDQVVTRASMEDIRKTYGGVSSSPFMYSSYGSSTNAYMLMYRQIDPDRNLKLPLNSQLPGHILRMIDKLHLEEEEQRRIEEKQRSLMTVRVNFYNPVSGILTDKEFEVQKRDPVSTVVEAAHEWFGLQSTFNIPLELCRLVKFSKQKETIECSVDSNKPMQHEFPWSYMAPELLLETAPRQNWFRQYVHNGITLKLYIVDLAAGRVRLPKRLLHVTKETTVEELKELAGELLDCSPDNMTLVLDHYSRNLRLLDVPHKSMTDEDMWCTSTIFVECGSGNSDEKYEGLLAEDFEKTRFYTILDQFKNTLRFNVVLPSVKEYETVGLLSPFKAVLTPLVVEEMEDVHMRSAESSPCPPLSTNIGLSGSTIGPNATGSGRTSLMIQQNEECSTTSGSTQYMTPATSRSNSPERLDSFTSPASQEGGIGPGTPELEVTLSTGSTPSPQVSPDASPVGLIRVEPPFERPYIGCEPPSYQLYENDLSKIEVDDCDWNPTENGEVDKKNGFAKDVDSASSEKIDYYFDVVGALPPTTSTTAPVLTVEADKRMLLSDFIQKIAPHVGVDSDQFKLYKTVSSMDYECMHTTTSTLDSLSTATALRIKLGRPLKEGEHMVKFLRFELNDLEAYGKHLFDIVLTKDSKIEDIKKECHVLLHRQCGLEIPLEKIRLRESGFGYMDILHDGRLLHDRTGYWAGDLYLQILEEPDIATTFHHSAIFVRRWCPSTLSLGPMQEIVLSPTSSENLTDRSSNSRKNELDFFAKVSQLSNIPMNRLQCSSASSEGSFPFECGKLKLLEEMTFYGLSSVEVDQTQQASSVSTGNDMDSEGDCRKDTNNDFDRMAGCSTTPYYMGRSGFNFQRGWGERSFILPHDGVLFYYRDSQEQPKTLNDDERKELQIRDNARLRKNQTSYTWRKERALKIYMETSSSLADELD